MAAAALFGGCAIELEVGRDIPERARVANVPWSFEHELDLLFVVDDSQELSTIHGETAMLWRRIRGNLAYAEGGFPDVRIGVISSDIGVGPASVPGCTARGADAALVPGADGALWLEVTEETAEWSEYELAARLAIEDAGCPYDQPFGAIQRALGGEQPLNDGFLRESAALGVVIVSGSDDCSVDDPEFWADEGGKTPVDPFRCFLEAVHCSGDDVYVGVQQGCIARQSPPHLGDARMTGELLRRLKDDPRTVVVTGVIGDHEEVEIVEEHGAMTLAPACDDPARPLLPGVRVASFVRDMGGTVAGVCDASVDSSAAPAALDLRDALGHRCIVGNVMDVEPETPGVQLDCLVEAVDRVGNRREMSRCPNPNNVIDAVGPCWAIKDGGLCDDFNGLWLQVNWGGAEPMTQPEGITASVSCVVEPDVIE